MEEKRIKVIKVYALACLFFIYSFLLSPSPLHAETRLRMSTTTSVEDSGLMKELLPPFEKMHDVKVDVIAVGTGQALKLGENGDVDLVFVHAKEAEEEFVAKGFGVKRHEVMYNDFIIIGPKDDPAGISGNDAVRALRLIAGKKSPFISRGDESGTHKKEKKIWELTGIKPFGSWYMETGQGMGATIQVATEKQGYSLADRGTFLAFEKKTDLVILCEGDEKLLNLYGIIAVNPARHPHVKYDLAITLINWITSLEGQRIIGEYKKDGKPLFIPSIFK